MKPHTVNYYLWDDLFANCPPQVLSQANKMYGDPLYYSSDDPLVKMYFHTNEYIDGAWKRIKINPLHDWVEELIQADLEHGMYVLR